MSNYKIKYSKVFKKSLKKVIKQGKNDEYLVLINTGSHSDIF